MCFLTGRVRFHQVTFSASLTCVVAQARYWVKPVDGGLGGVQDGPGPWTSCNAVLSFCRDYGHYRNKCEFIFFVLQIPPIMRKNCCKCRPVQGIANLFDICSNPGRLDSYQVSPKTPQLYSETAQHRPQGLTLSLNSVSTPRNALVENVFFGQLSHLPLPPRILQPSPDNSLTNNLRLHRNCGFIEPVY